METLYVEHAAHENILGRERVILAICNDRRQEVARVDSYAVGVGQARAYAVIFAAGPDLAKALLQIATYDQNRLDAATLGNIARAALAKAGL